jgi:hypothetical protein
MSNLVTYNGKHIFNNDTACHLSWERYFRNAARAIEFINTTYCGEYAVLNVEEYAAVWAMHRFQMSTPIPCSTSCMKLKAKYTPSNASDLVQHKWDEMSRIMGEHSQHCTRHIWYLRFDLDLHLAMPTKMFFDDFGYWSEKRNWGVYLDLFGYIGKCE